MKILIAASKYLPAVGGLEKSVHCIALEFLKRNHEVCVITNRFKRNLPPQDNYENISVRRYFFTGPYPRSKSLWIWFKYLVRLAIAPYSFFALLWKIKKAKPEVVHLHFVGSIAGYVLLARVFLKFPLIVSLHGSDVEKFEEKQFLEKKTFKGMLNVRRFCNR